MQNTKEEKSSCIKVSIIIPVYNVEPYLRRCLDSIVNQTLKEIEIICINDGSTDNSLKILEDYAKQDDRLKIITIQNSGVSVARNIGIKNSTGEYIGFVDSDDWIDFDFYEKLYNSVELNNYDIVKADMIRVYSNKSELSSLNNQIKNNIYFFTSEFYSAIYKKNFLNNNKILFPVNIITGEDIVFSLQCVLAKPNLCIMKGTNYYYYKERENSKSKTLSTQKILSLYEQITTIINLLNSSDISKEEYANIVERFSYRQMIRRLKLGEYNYQASLDILTELQKRLKSLLKYNLPDIVDVDLRDLCQKYIGKLISLSDVQLENIENYSDKKVLSSVLRDKEYCIKYLFKNIEDYKHRSKSYNLTLLWGLKMWKPQPETMRYAIENNVPLIRAEDGFIRSADTWCNTTVNTKYINGISYTFTNDVFHYDATQSSYMERQINNPDFVLTKEQRIRAKNAIDFIIKNHLTKYNHQPIYTPNIGREGVLKVLVVDQSYGDFSISRGLADDDTFREMLEVATKENPNADIIVKTHPDALAPGSKRASGYYSTLQPHDNIYVLREPINPISLLKYIDKVYVCTTQLGFEALMCGKEVHTFGMPFYAGWGLTTDKLKCERRTAKRTLEELFYITYIKNTHYIDPEKKCPCSIERAMEYLIELRDEYKNNPIPPVKEKGDKDISFIQKIFSVRNQGIRKVVTIFGIKFKFKSKKLQSRNNLKTYKKKKIVKDLIISLTSYPARINTVYQTIESLLNQTLAAEKIVLWLSDTQFPNLENDLPSNLLKLKEDGLEIEWYHQEHDIKPYNKLINTLKKYPDKIIITVDDDIIYEKDRIIKLYKEYLKNPQYIHCHRAHRILFKNRKILPYNKWEHEIKNVKPSYNNFLTGVGCVLYPPHCFYKDILREDLFVQLAPEADDIWFWAMAVLNGTKINVVKNNYRNLTYVNGTQETALWKTNVTKNQNDPKIQKVLSYYPQILKRLDKHNYFYNNLAERIFSVKNENMKKIVTILGVRLKFKSKRLKQKQKLQDIEKRLANQQKLSMNNRK